MRATGTVRRRSFTRLGAVLAAGGLLVAGCASGGASGDSGAAETDAVSTGWVGERPEGGEPQSGNPQPGGTLAYATYNSVSSLDPADRQDGGATGGTEMAAIYGLLMRYDPAADEYVPQLAESLTANDDDTVWTLTLRDGVTFNDGTPLDADAVVWSIDHYLQKRGTHSQVWQASVDSTVAQGPQTVVFTLKRPWSAFPSMLTTGPGMVVAPSSTASGKFTPVGAGPFTVTKFAPQNELVLTAREDYWGGAPHLDELRFPAIVQEQGKVDALNTGGIEAAYLRNTDVVHGAITGGLRGWSYAANMSGILQINSRPDRAGADPLVRQAIVAAVDPEFFDQRVNGGYGAPGSAMFQESSVWNTGTGVETYDPERARTLLDEAMADGFDGVLSYAGVNAPAAQQSALAAQAMLEAVGFTVELNLTNNINDLIKTMYAEHDYDIGYSAFNVLDDAPFVRLYGNLHSESTSNAMGYADPQMDGLLLDVQTARSEDEKRDVLARIQQRVIETAPFATIGAGRAFVAMGETARGVQPSQDGIMLFDEAWIDQG